MSAYEEVQEITSPIRDYLNRRGVPVAEAREGLAKVEQLLRTFLSVREQQGVVLEYWSPGGYTIQRVCEEMVELADELQVPLKTEFNGIIVRAYPGDSSTILAENYFAARRKMREDAAD